MKIFLLCVTFPVLFLAGCSLNSQFVGAVDAAWSEIGTEYVQYVDRDPTLSTETKELRKSTALELTKTLEEAKQ